MNTWQTSLRCLIHPITIFSICLLILNDHFLKAAYPSWLTGKLSDFAGLFFFPFLLAAVLHFFLNRVRLTPRIVGALAFLVTAVWFPLIKTTDWGNALTENLVSLLLFGTKSHITRDPTDMMALPVMMPAWVLWTRTEAVQAKKLGPRAWLVLLMAAFASMATSPWPPVAQVRLLTSTGRVVYANGIANSTDGGRTWQTFGGTLPTTHQVTLPLTLCDAPDN